MDVKLIYVATNEIVDAIILPATGKELPLNNNGWNFNWKQLYNSHKVGNTENKKGVMFYKVVLKQRTEIIEGLIMVSVIDGKMVYLNVIEVAPHNYGSKGRYKNVAGCLIAYACFLSVKYGKDNYKGFLSFDSKTNLIKLYQEKYGAVLISSQKMYINDTNGKKLVKLYLDIDL